MVVCLKQVSCTVELPLRTLKSPASNETSIDKGQARLHKHSIALFLRFASIEMRFNPVSHAVMSKDFTLPGHARSSVVLYFADVKKKVKQLQAWTGPEGS